MCGYPCSGKTRRAEELKGYFEQKTTRKVHIVGDGALDIDKNSVYADSQKEKNARAALKAEVERWVSPVSGLEFCPTVTAFLMFIYLF